MPSVTELTQLATREFTVCVRYSGPSLSLLQPAPGCSCGTQCVYTGYVAAESAGGLILWPGELGWSS